MLVTARVGIAHRSNPSSTDLGPSPPVTPSARIASSRVQTARVCWVKTVVSRVSERRGSVSDLRSHADRLEQRLEQHGPDEATVTLHLTDNVFLRSSTCARWQLGIPHPPDCAQPSHVTRHQDRTTVVVDEANRPDGGTISGTHHGGGFFRDRRLPETATLCGITTRIRNGEPVGRTRRSEKSDREGSRRSGGPPS